MRSIATVVAIAGLVLTGLLFGPGPSVPAASAAPALNRGTGAVPLRLDLTDMSPRVVTSDGPDTLTINGTLVNTGEQPVDQLVVRVQRGNALTTEGELRDALAGNAATDAVTPQFEDLADSLAPGASTPIRLTVPLRGAPESGLALSQTGIYELLVNVNGVPEGGARARVAAVRVLLPVLSLPAGDDGTRAVAGPRFAGTQFSLLYPIADRPHRISTVPGERTMLDDDSLAASFAPGGRLQGLVAAIAQDAPPGSQVRAATCLAVDPDLVATADAMRGGYDVRGPAGALVPGTGAQAAGQWLDQLIAVAKGGCVIALPYADADLVALTRNGLGATATAAITDGREVLADELQLTSALPAVTWPADGATDEATLATIAQAGDKAMVLSADSVEANRTRTTNGVVTLAGSGGQYAALTDPLLALAARGPIGDTTASNGIGQAAATTSPAGTNTPLSTQDTVGALAFRAQQAGPTTDADGPMVLAPPQTWGAEGVGARALLQTVGRMVGQGALVPRGILDVLRSGPDPDTAERAVDYPVSAGEREIPAAVVDTVRRTAQGLADLLTAAVEPEQGSGVGVSPDEAFTPARQGLVRPASAALRGHPDDADAVADEAADRIAELRAKVHVLEPQIPYSLGTSDAPLPLTIVNGLPVTVRVEVGVSPASGLQVAPLAEQRIPPQGRRQLSVTAKVTRSGQFTVDATVSTPGGGQLGPPSRLKVVSTAYGTITVWLTATAGVVLVALVARRVVRRRRGAPGNHPGPVGPSAPLPDPRDLPPDQRGRPLHGADTGHLPGLRPVPAPEDLAVTDPLPGRRPDLPRTPTPRP